MTTIDITDKFKRLTTRSINTGLFITEVGRTQGAAMNSPNFVRVVTLIVCLIFSAILTVANASPNQTNPALEISATEKQQLLEIRKNVFGGARLDAAFRQTTITGLEPPLFPLNVDNRGLIVWELDPQHVPAFALQVGLVPPFVPAAALPIVVNSSQSIANQSYRAFEQKGLGFLLQLFYPKKYYVIADIGETDRAEQGAKVELKTFIQLPGSPHPSLYRFASFKAIPGTDLMQLSNQVASQINITKAKGRWAGSLNALEGELQWDVALKTRRGNNRTTQKPHLSQWYLDASERQFAPFGSSSRYYYDGSSVSAVFNVVKSRKTKVSHNFAWSNFVKPKPQVIVLSDTSEFLVQPVTAPVTQFAGGIGACEQALPVQTSSQLFASLVGCAITQVPPPQVFGLLFSAFQQQQISPQELSTLYYGLLDLYQGFAIAGGIEKPKLFFTLLPSPKTLFINFEIPAHKAAAFKKAFLPSSFELAKMRFYPQQKKAVYAISLNIYQSVGQNLSGYRAEWSTYVINPDEIDPKPRFSVLEAQTDIGSFDPVVALERYQPGMDLSDPTILFQLIEPPSDLFTFSESDENGIEVTIRDAVEGIEVDVDIDYPSTMLATQPTTQWMEANDFVYWGRVADILKYDQQVMFADLLVFEAGPSDLIHDTTFSGYVNPRPLPIILWNGGQDIALEPWGNLDMLGISE